MADEHENCNIPTNGADRNDLRTEIRRLRVDLLTTNLLLGAGTASIAICVGVGFYFLLNVFSAIEQELALVRNRYSSENSHSMVMHMTIKSQGAFENVDCTRVKADNSCVIDAWHQNNVQDFATIEDGIVHILMNGTYFIYIQISYSQKRGQFSFAVFIDDDVFVKCTWTEWGIQQHDSLHACHTSAVNNLHSHQNISVRYWYSDSNIHPVKESTFWGLVKLA